VCPTLEQFAAEVAWPGDWPDAQAGEEPTGSPGRMDEPRMDEDMTDLFDVLGGSGATTMGSPDSFSFLCFIIYHLHVILFL